MNRKTSVSSLPAASEWLGKSDLLTSASIWCIFVRYPCDFACRCFVKLPFVKSSISLSILATVASRSRIMDRSDDSSREPVLKPLICKQEDIVFLDRQANKFIQEECASVL